MRKILTAILYVIMANTITQAQERMIIEKTDGTTVEYIVSEVAKVYFEAPASEFVNGFEAVDLGLSIKWASCNIGAATAEDYGDYFAWGETEIKSDYSTSTSKWYELNYLELQAQGIIDDYGNLTPQYDVAVQKQGERWRMPTITEFKELVENCTWELTTRVNSKGIEVNGYVVTGPNGNTIFMLAGGYFGGKSLNGRGEYGNFWSATADTHAYNAYDLHFNSENAWTAYYARSYGYNVRPVCERATK